MSTMAIEDHCQLPDRETADWKEEQSTTRPLYSGTGQGTILGLFLFTVMFSDAGPNRSDIKLGEVLTQGRLKRKPLEEVKKKWVDDLTVYTPLDLPANLEKDIRPLERPLNITKNRKLSTY